MAASSDESSSAGATPQHALSEGHAVAVDDPSSNVSSSRKMEATSSSFQAINRPSSAMAEDGKEASDQASHPSSQAATPVPQKPQSDAASSEKLPSQVDNLDGAASDAATYGTRSRNRTGNARPNYAEDQDYDYDFVSSAATTTAMTKKAQQAASASNGQAGSDAKRAKDSSQPAPMNDTGPDTTSTSNQPADAKEASSQQPVNPRKRKAQSGQTSTPPAAVASAAVTRKPAAPTAHARETNVLSFSKSKSCLNSKGQLVADDGTKLSVNDHVYLVSEPPGDPYYLCRIMEFLHVKSDQPTSPVDSLRVNWYYRPRDVQRFNNDTRLVYATMHSDMCPLTSVRGKCTIKHRTEISDLEAYRKERDSFYFTQVFDRFIRRWYECIPTSAINNVPEKVKKALDERWKFVAVEVGRVKELTSAVKTCKRCAKYCASHDSVDCAICACSYHMNCVQPPLPKKPSRGFAWACGPCSRASERKMEARNTPTQSGEGTDAEEEVEEEQPVISDQSTRAPSPIESAMPVDDHPATQAEIALAKMWPMRYLGIHARVEDALQYDDRAIYPRASSRLGPRHQANVPVWHGHPVELVKPAEIKKRFIKGNNQKKEGKLSKETVAALEADRIEKAKRPKWVQDEPPGYLPRGEDYPNDDPRNTARLLFKMPEDANEDAADSKKDIAKSKVTKYVYSAHPLAKKIGVPPFGTNFLDKAVELYTASNYNEEEALAKLAKIDRVKDLHEPVLSKADLAKFEEGVSKYGSEHRLVRLHMKTTLSHADIVRFYYLWKKTPKGKDIWGKYPGRKGKKRLENDAAARLHDEVAHDADDSAFDNEKASKHKRGFMCKFCNTTTARQWRRAPGASPGQTILSDARTGNKDKRERLLVALCSRCANLWRKYAIQWEELDEVSKKTAAGGGKAWKKRIDEELLRELLVANDSASSQTPEPPANAIYSIDGAPEPLKKRSKAETAPLVEPKKKEKPAPPPKPPTPEPPPIIPAQPLWRDLPCSVCRSPGETVVCAHCKLSVHWSCYGLAEIDGVKPDSDAHWVCDQCQNDRNPLVSTEYSCCLCLTEVTDTDLVEPPRVTHKKKSERDREKERLEKELADAMRAEYHNKQLMRNRPLLPREPLKKTTGNNWVHVYCAVWTPEIRFSDAKALEVAEGFQLIPPARHEAVCKLCKNKDHQNKVRNDKGACVLCHQCQTPFHVSCAFEAGYQFGFDVTPVKGSRKDQITTATLGAETGALTAAVWCKEHVVKTIIHPMHEIADDTGRTALQVYVENYKQADLTLTGTVRKAQLVQSTKEKSQQTAQAVPANNRRESAANGIAAAVRRGARTSTVSETKQEDADTTEHFDHRSGSAPPTERRCVKCKIDVTPKWHPVTKDEQLSSRFASTRSLGDKLLENSPAVTDITGAPITRHPQQHARHGQPGITGRTWDALTDRLAQVQASNGDSRVTEPMQIDSVENTTESGQPSTNGDRKPPQENASAPKESRPREPDYLCHKCFIKKKLEPSPPRRDPARIGLSPPRRFPSHWIGATPTPQLPMSRPAWDDPGRASQAHPPHPQAPPSQPTPINHFGPNPNYVAHPVPPHAYPQGYHQTNGYHALPPGPPGQPTPIHDDGPAAFSYHSQPPSNPPSFSAHSPPRHPPPLNGFPPPGQPLPNGLPSPHHLPPQHSPTYPHPHSHQHQPPPPPPPTHHQYPSHRESFSTQMPSIGLPNHHDHQPVTRAEMLANTQQGQSANGSSPRLASSQLLGRPSTPRDGRDARDAQGQSQVQGGSRSTPAPSANGNAGGASASPSLRNLLS